MKLASALMILCLFGCNQSYQYSGTFHKNQCLKGASYILINGEKLAVGRGSNNDFQEVLQRLSRGKKVDFNPVSKSGCEKVYSLKLNGQIKDESSLTGYGNDEVRRVIHVQEFSFQ